MLVLSMFKLAGEDVELDPRSSDFGKGRIGRARFDFWGGFQPLARYTAQLLSGEFKSTRTGKTFPTDFEGLVIDDPRAPENIPRREKIARGAAPTVKQFLRSKLAPGPASLAVNELTGRTFLGDPLDQPQQRGRPPEPFRSGFQAVGADTARTEQVLEQVTPLFMVDLADAVEEFGIPGGISAALPGLLGVGVQVFEPQEGERQEGQGQTPIEDLPGTGFPIK